MSDDEDDSIIYWKSPPPATSSGLLSRLSGSSRASRERMICTRPGVGAGETETEADEPPRHLPTSRKRPASKPLIPPNTLQQVITPLLFEFSRLLSIVPAIFGTLYNLYHVYEPRNDDPQRPQRVDYAVSALWAILTGYQCLCLATGLLARWRAYYPPLATLIRLLALQAICWPATHFTLSILGHEQRPVITWAVIGTSTCMSRSIQLWVTSNLWCENGDKGDKGKQSWRGGQWVGRRWDWKEVGIQCMLPAGVVYFVMAWAEQLRREWGGC